MGYDYWEFCEGPMKHFMKKHIFFVYLFLSFLISWLGWLVLVFTNTEPGFFNPWKLLAAFGPSLAGIIAISINNGKPGLQELWHRLTLWRVRWIWYLVCLAAPPALMLASLGIHVLLGGQGLMFNDPAELYRVIPVFLLVFFFSVLGEEIGWRGFLLPWLQRRFSALASSLILGVIWAAWHLPLFWIPGDFHQQLSIVWFVLQTVAITILYTWVFNGTKGSLFLILLLHASSNTAFGVLPMLPETANGSTRPAWLLNLLLFLAVVLVILVNRPKTLAKRKSKTT
jgi:membrane protease YdiL (CAAX protease family)